MDYALTTYVDYKTELQEELARRNLSVSYSVLEVEGPPHDRRFTCAATIDGEAGGHGNRRVQEGGRAERRPRGARVAASARARGQLPRRLRDFARVFLRAVNLRGFKSFPDPVEVLLEPGVAVVVGPNGSGKSNIADAVRWAAGSLSTTELRAEKPEDVLFAGAEGRAAADVCSVELLFDNAGGEGPLPFEEVSVARKLTRGGEGRYLVNGATVRRTDLVELLADMGIGGEMHSVIGQGRVEQILASKPAERRALVEEAAGLGRFKRQRHRAELKLTRVADQVERARDLEAEVRKRSVRWRSRRPPRSGRRSWRCRSPSSRRGSPRPSSSAWTPRWPRWPSGAPAPRRTAAAATRSSPACSRSAGRRRRS